MERNDISKLPEDILEEIMLRVPLESMVECICVCKKWRSTIRGEGFKNRHWLKSMTRPRLMFRYCEFSRQTLSKLSESAYQQERPFLSYGRKEMPEMISSPYGGLVCFRLKTKYGLCNPGTKKFKAIPECHPLGRKDIGNSMRVCSFGYNEVTKVFKLFMSERYITPAGHTLPHQVFTVNLADNSFQERSWRQIVSQHSHFPCTDSLCINGFMYYGAYSLVGNDKHMVISFNLVSDLFTVIDLPDGVNICVCATLVNYNGKVCLVNDLGKYQPGKDLEDGSREFEIYVKDENADTFGAEPLVVLGWRDAVGDMSFDFKGTIGTGGELVFATCELHDGSHFVLYYDKATENLRKCKFEGVDGGLYHFVETFVTHYDSLLLT